MAKVTSHYNGTYMRVDINGIPHITFREQNLVAIQSWIDNDDPPYAYKVEIYCKDFKDPVLCEYLDKELWIKIINALHGKE